MADYGIKISKQGVGIISSDSTDQNLNSDSITIMSYVNLIGTTDDSTNVTHNLGYYPAYLVYVTKDSDKSTIKVGKYDPWSLATWGTGQRDFSSRTNTTMLYVYDPGTGTYTHAYFIFSEKSYA